MEQTCNKCKETKPLTDFVVDKKLKSGYRKICKLCKQKQTRDRKQKIKTLEKPIITEKECSTCKQTMTVSHFTKCSTLKDGYNIMCKECRHILIAKWHADKKTQSDMACDKNITKNCYICNFTKALSEFRINRKSIDGHSHICNSCQPKNTWTKEKQRLSEKRYCEKHPEKLKEKWKRAGKNINRRIRDSLNHRISEALLTKNVTKRNRTVDYLGCTIEFFKKYIEFQFTGKMSWETYGKWHLDHVTPCSHYNLQVIEEVKECFNWKNIRPLRAKKNLEKSDKIDIKVIASHKRIVEKFISAQVKSGELREHPKISSTKLIQ